MSLACWCGGCCSGPGPDVRVPDRSRTVRSLTRVSDRLRNKTFVGRERPAERGIWFGRINEGVEKPVPGPLADCESFAFGDQAIGGFERVVDDESRNRRVRQRRRALQHVLRHRIDANLHSFGFGVPGSHQGFSLFDGDISQSSSHVKSGQEGERVFARSRSRPAVSRALGFIAD